MKTTAFAMTFLMALSAMAGSSSTRVPASVTKLTVQCTPPKGFAGLSATVSGELKLSAIPNGAAKATGKLQVSLNDPRNPWKGEKTVLGQYDDLTSVGSDRYFHGGATMKNDSDVLEIYVNYTRSDLSYVEYAGETYKMSCK